jgi:hypothetical protein
MLDTRMFRYLSTTDADFSTFFLHFYKLPFDTWASLDHRRFDCVMRFERLADDFDATRRCARSASSPPGVCRLAT